MHEEPIDRSRDLWIERKRRFEQEEAARRDELLDARYRSAHEGSSRFSPPHQSNHDPRYAHLPPSTAHPANARHASSPRSQLPLSLHPPAVSPADEEAAMREDVATTALKRRRLGDGLDRDDRRRDEPINGARSPPFRRADGATHSAPRYLDERDAYVDDLRSPLNPPYANRPNGRLSPLDRPMHSPNSVGGGPLPPMQDGAHRPSVLSSSNYDDSLDHGPGMLARRRGDAAQAKASRLHIDTGSGSAFEASALGRSSSGIAKSAPPQKLSFGFDNRDHPLPQDQAPREANLRPNHASQQPSQPLAPARPEQQQRHVSGSRQAESSDALRREERDDVPGLREGRLPEIPHTANPLARQGPSTRLAGGGHIPQTATLPSPAYHTTQFARGHPGGRQAYNPPPTARLPEHLRSPPSSKPHFLSLFSDFYDSLYDSRTLKATLEDQIKRSNTLLQTLQSSRRVLEETVERRVRDERVLWEGRVRGLEARVRELEAKTGTDYDDEPLSRSSELAALKGNAHATSASSSRKGSAPLSASDAAAVVAEKAEENIGSKPSSRERSPLTAPAKRLSSSSCNNKDEDEGDQLQDD
ncbi:hypothetical protein EX895_006312 [Sporisorium graminicola]|uniref:Uncharacterized protein n=1 Tax=Sporisorium graminicola TaxID=280036 RepID=A0A4U7KQG4_9BASI|nr:hypothetical protein EX895_006312 [Sporisorium graminicola]TKY85232.1 hypothetical protein EX895_006312 [Sporisorium graminicola]